RGSLYMQAEVKPGQPYSPEVAALMKEPGAARAFCAANQLFPDGYTVYTYKDDPRYIGFNADRNGKNYDITYNTKNGKTHDTSLKMNGSGGAAYGDPALEAKDWSRLSVGPQGPELRRNAQQTLSNFDELSCSAATPAPTAMRRQGLNLG